MAHVRSEFGYGVHLLHDVHHRLTPIEAARLGADLEPYRMFWMEDPTPAEDQSAFRLIRSHTTTPIAVGEVLNSIWDCQQLITERLIDYIRTSVSHAGGITHLRRIFALADLYGVRSGSHGAGDLSPIAMAAALHVDLSIPNFGIQEYMGHRDPVGEVFGTAYTFRDGYMHPGDQPGLGVTFDEAGRGSISVRPQVPADQPPPGRLGARLVSTAKGDRMRIGLVGYGTGGKNFHSPYIEAATDCELAGIVARAPATVAQARTDWPVTPIFGSLGDMIDSGVDAVTISTPPATRRDLVLEAVGRGIHAVADKPFAPSADAAAELVRGRRREGVVECVPQSLTPHSHAA